MGEVSGRGSVGWTVARGQRILLDQLQGILRRELKVVGYALHGRVQPVDTEAQGQSMSKQTNTL